MRINSEFRKKIADSWFSYLQAQICKSFENLEGNKLKFSKRDWYKKNIKEGGGTSYLLTKGKIFRYEDYDNFLNKNRKKRIILMTTKAKKLYYKFKFKKNDMLLFGRESAGVPEYLHKAIKDKVKVPMNKKTRSLNVAMSVAIISAEALRQNNLLK